MYESMTSMCIMNFEILYILKLDMFVTETVQQGHGWRRRRSFSRSKRISRYTICTRPQQFEKFIKCSTPVHPEKRQSNNWDNEKPQKFFPLKRTLRTVEKDWLTIVNLYNNYPNWHESQPHHQISNRKYSELLGYELCCLFAESAEEQHLKINFPETLIDTGSDIRLICTNRQTGHVHSRIIQRGEHFNVMKGIVDQHMIDLQKHPNKYRKYYDFNNNQYAPVIVTKTTDGSQVNKFEVEVENYRIFQQKRTKPTCNRLLQRYIYPRNMKAIVVRLCYNRKRIKQQKQQFYALRFQNVDGIFWVNKKHSEIYETSKIKATVYPIQSRANRVEESKISNRNGLIKFIPYANNLIRFIERIKREKIEEIAIDFTVDLFDTPWVLGIKHIRTSQLSEGLKKNPHCSSMHMLGNWVCCRVCSGAYDKKDLKKTISNKILIQFLGHLRKRMPIADYNKVEFVKNIAKVYEKDHITFQVCESCYQVIAQEYKLMDCQRKLARICNINANSQAVITSAKPGDFPQKLYQWRIMMFLVDVINVPTELINRGQSFLVKYSLGDSDLIEQSWKIDICDQTRSDHFGSPVNCSFNLNKVKVHYFFSQTADIDCFLKDTEINMQLQLSGYNFLAKGSSAVISSFRHRLSNGLCLRQTSSMLLFYKNGKYCELSIKVGLICDGLHHFCENNSLNHLNGVYFSHRNFMNTNPIPPQWMEAFGIHYDTFQTENSPQENLIDLENSSQTPSDPHKSPKPKTIRFCSEI